MSVLRHIDPTLLFTIFLLFGFSVITFAFALTPLFHKPKVSLLHQLFRFLVKVVNATSDTNQHLGISDGWDRGDFDYAVYQLPVPSPDVLGGIEHSLAKHVETLQRSLLYHCH